LNPEMRALARANTRRWPPAFLSLAALLTFGVLGLSGGRGPVTDQKAVTTQAGTGPQVIERTVWSDSLGRDMPLTVYLPPGYQANPAARYPVLYMLHGLGGDHQDWQREGLFAIATQLIGRGDIPPMIIVTPEGEQGYWIDDAGGGPRYGSYVANDLVAAIDHEYRTNMGSRFRAIGGMSMGAHGALQLALNNPGEFGVVGAHSLVLRNKEQAFAFFGDQTYFAAHDPVSILQRDRSAARGLVLWIDIGDEDGWLGAASTFNNQLQTEGVAHSWHVYRGGHTAEYWSAHLVDYLRFYGDAFRSASGGV
jgi:enterochelin esterase-like enzyme